MRIFIYLTLVAVSSWAKTQDLLPSPLKEFQVNKTNLKVVLKNLGKEDLKEGRRYYWEKDGFKYAIELTFSESLILKSIHYTFTKNKPSLEKLDLKDLNKLAPYPSSGRDAGRFLILKEKRRDIIIDPVNKKIKSVRIR